MVDATHEVGGGVGVGWGGDDNVLCICTHGWSFLALAHMVCATQDHVSCTCTHGWCYATSCFWHSDDEQAWPEPLSPLSRDIERGRRQLLESEVCKERRDSYVLTAGDNCAESLCAVSKKQLRRTNLNIAVVRDKIEHRYLLSSHFLNKAPGLARIMQALRCHKMKCMSWCLPQMLSKSLCGNSDSRAPRKKG